MWDAEFDRLILANSPTCVDDVLCLAEFFDRGVRDPRPRTVLAELDKYFRGRPADLELASDDAANLLQIYESSPMPMYEAAWATDSALGMVHGRTTARFVALLALHAMVPHECDRARALVSELRWQARRLLWRANLMPTTSSVGMDPL
jgi:hypothetical protein